MRRRRLYQVLIAGTFAAGFAAMLLLPLWGLSYGVMSVVVATLCLAGSASK